MLANKHVRTTSLRCRIVYIELKMVPWPLTGRGMRRVFDFQENIYQGTYCVSGHMQANSNPNMCFHFFVVRMSMHLSELGFYAGSIANVKPTYPGRISHSFSEEPAVLQTVPEESDFSSSSPAFYLIIASAQVDQLHPDNAGEISRGRSGFRGR